MHFQLILLYIRSVLGLQIQGDKILLASLSFVLNFLEESRDEKGFLFNRTDIFDCEMAVWHYRYSIYYHSHKNTHIFPDFFDRDTPIPILGLVLM